MANGIPSDKEVTFITTNKAIAQIINGQLIAVGKGEVELIPQLVDYPNIQIPTTLIVTVGDIENFSAYIEGKDTIRLGCKNEYTLKGTSDLQSVSINFNLEPTNLAKIETIKNNSCIIIANEDNLLGKIILHAQYNNQDYTKEIEVIPLWR